MYLSDIKSQHFKLSDVFKISSTLEFKRKFDDALKVIEHFFTLCNNPAVSCGGGKDGTAVLILAQYIKPDIKVICADPPNPIDGRDEHLNNLFNNTKCKIYRCEYNWDVESVLKGDLIYPDGFKMKVLQQKQKELNVDGIIWGCRNSESRSRTINFAKNGYIYQVKDGTYRCQPIAKWSPEEVLALAFATGYPINPIYEKIEGIYNLDHIHDGTWWPHGDDCSKKYWIKKYYPQHLDNYEKAEKLTKSYNYKSCIW